MVVVLCKVIRLVVSVDVYVSQSNISIFNKT